MRAAAFLAAFLISLNPATAETYRITCSNFEGVRAQYAAHPSSPPAQKNRLVREQDSITGVRVELIISNTDARGAVTLWGNVNTGGQIGAFELTRVTRDGYLSFMGIDPSDGSTNLFSLFPNQERLLWTIHTNKISVLDQIVLGKTLIGQCQLSAM